MKNTKNNNSATSKDFSAREVGVLLESMDTKINLLVDAQTNNTKRFDNIDKHFDDMHKEMDYKFEVVFDELKVIKGDLSIVKEDVSSIKKDYVKGREFVALEERVTALEK